MVLDVQLFGRDIQITDRTRDYVTKKVSKLDRYLDNITEARVDLAYVESARDVNDRYVAQITIQGKGFILRAEERADDIFAALDQALPKIRRRMKRYKGKHYDQRHRMSTAEVAAELMEEPEGEEMYEIVRRKHFILTPMDEREAIEQMELLGHQNFFVFLDANSGQINVLYKRRDGKYGVIEPEIA
jgi:putative sigma-54 modulation protein